MERLLCPSRRQAGRGLGRTSGGNKDGEVGARTGIRRLKELTGARTRADDLEIRELASLFVAALERKK